jgi:hypothetical protein
MNEIGFFDKLKITDWREALLDSLCKGIQNSSDFRDMLEYVINDSNFQLLYNNDIYNSHLYEDDSDILVELILPALRRVWGKLYIDIPAILKNRRSTDSRLEIYQALFDIDEFLIYLNDMLLISKDILKDFKNLDRTLETITLIVDNYISGLIKIAYDSDNRVSALRQIKINKIIK